MKSRSILSAATMAVVISLGHAAAATAAEVKVLSALGIRPALTEIAPQFERATGHRLVIQYDSSPGLRRKIEAGEAFDLVIVSPNVIDEFTKQGKVASGTRAAIARSGMVVAVRAGASKRDISSVDAFKRTLLSAKSITYAPETVTGLHLSKVFARLGIAEEMKARTKPQKNAEAIAQAVAAGEAELGFTVASTTLETPGAVILGPFPSELQDYVVYAGAIAAAAKEPGGAKALIDFLRTERAVSIIKAKGLEPLDR